MKKEQCVQDSFTHEKNNKSVDAPPPPLIQDSASSNDTRKISRQDIELVQNLIERCLQLYMNKDEVVKTLLTRARIDPGFTTLVWQKLEEENADFFRAYYIRLKLKKQIILFNHLLEHQYHLMKYPPKIPLAPVQNGMLLPIAPGNMPMGYPILQHPQMHVPGHPIGMTNCHVVSGVPVPSNFQPLKFNSTNDVVTDTTAENENGTAETPQVIPLNNEIPASPASVASTGNIPVIDTTTTTTTSVLDIEPTDGNSLRSLDQIPWNFSLADLDLSNLGEMCLADLEALGDYSGSPFLNSDSDIFLDSSEQEDLEEFLVDAIPGPSCSTNSKEDEEKP